MISATIIAATLIMTPPDVHIPDIDRYNTPKIRKAIVTLCINLQILDPKEQAYYVNNERWSSNSAATMFEKDLLMLRKRYDELRDAPSIAECDYLPPRLIIFEYLRFNQDYRRNLLVQQAINVQDSGWYQQVINETDQLYRIWDYASDAQMSSYYITVRRKALQSMRREMENAGWKHMPPHVPIWRFRSIN